MKWIDDFQLFLFDFDGLLVNTEAFHLLAYKNMLKKRGFDLQWDFNRFTVAAHSSSEGLREQIYYDIPELFKSEPNWSVVYAEKRAEYLRLISEKEVELMPGVKEFLKLLEQKDIKRCVVTHSPKVHIDAIRSKSAILNTIPKWYTREDYTNAKPSPECYQKAVFENSVDGDRIIGFEDTVRGIKALQGTRAVPVMVSAFKPTGIDQLKKGSYLFIPSLEELNRLDSLHS
ncbi:MAG: HAD family phosphatase [Parachlamydiales bacterium]|nr:HAD family phosphatase [Parachlamydiales bacterium]